MPTTRSHRAATRAGAASAPKGVAQPGDQDVLDRMPDQRGAGVRYPDDENPDEERPDIAPQEGHVEVDPETVREASPGAD